MNSVSDRQSSATLEISLCERAHGWAVDIQDEAGGRRQPLVEGRVVVGSSSRADVVVHDPTVSALHCALTPVPGGVAIEDLGSTNGTYVGGARVREARGVAGTSVVVGRSSFDLCALFEDDHDDDSHGAPLEGVAGGSTIMRRVAAKVRRVAGHTLPVLITGESGTGKELIARAIHREGPRAKMALVTVNVAALPRDLVESELFGHERGAFTGAVARRPGAFSEAEGGTLFLDEIGELPIEAQPKLLRALDGYDVRRVGMTGAGKKPTARIVAATNVTLVEAVREARFRLDLYHRLNVMVIALPPLRARRGDIGPIAREVLRHAPREFGCRDLTPRALARLLAHDWPGNVRELRSALYRGLDATRGERPLEASDIDRAIRSELAPLPLTLTPRDANAILTAHEGNLSAAARAAGLPRTSYRKLLRG